MDTVTDALLRARARVLRDLSARGLDTAECVSAVDEVLSQRRWWVDQWPDGAAFATCLVAQDVQEAMTDLSGRWPVCHLLHEDDDPGVHQLHVAPDLGEDPHWVCEESGVVVAPVGSRPAVGPAGRGPPRG
jgi:hypothetical protein